MSKPDGLRKPGRRNDADTRQPEHAGEEADRADSRTVGHRRSDLPGTDELEANTAEQSKAGPDKLRDTVGAFSRKAAGTVAEATAAAAERVQDASSKVVSATDSLSQEARRRTEDAAAAAQRLGDGTTRAWGGNRLGCKPVDGRYADPPGQQPCHGPERPAPGDGQGQCHDL